MDKAKRSFNIDTGVWRYKKNQLCDNDNRASPVSWDPSIVMQRSRWRFSKYM